MSVRLFVFVGAVVAASACERAPAHQRTRSSETVADAAPVAEPAVPEQSLVLPERAPGDGCGDQLDKQPTGDLYLKLTRGTEEIKAAAALAIMNTRSQHARAVVQRAIATVGTHPFCPQLKPLTDTLSDVTMDDATRASAALALGMIAKNHPCTFPGGNCPGPHNPIPSWSQRALHDCAAGTQAMVARACVEALGYVPSTDHTFLVALRDDESQDPLVRVFAGRALTRLTQTPQVTKKSLGKLMSTAHGLVAP